MQSEKELDSVCNYWIHWMDHGYKAGLEWLIGRTGTIPVGPVWCWGRKIFSFLFFFFFFGPLFSHGSGLITAVPGPPPPPLAALIFLLLFYFADSPWCRTSVHSVSGVWKMESGKSRGGAEKARIKKRKALETDAAEYANISNFFTKTSLMLVTSNEDDETGEAICWTLPANHHSS